MSTTVATAPTARKVTDTRTINWGRILSYVLLVLFAIIYLGPLLMLVSTSLKTLPDFMKNATSLPTSLNFKNFTEAWTRANFPRYLTNTVLYTVSATVIYLVTAVFVAFPISRGYVKGAKILLTLFVIALFLPVALIPQFQLMLALGLYNNPFGYVLLFLVNPIGIIILVNYIKTLPKEMDEAAAIDGCGPFQIFWRIILPLLGPALAVTTAFTFIWTWDDFFGPLIYLSDIRSYTVQLGLRTFVDSSAESDWSGLFAMSILTLVPVFVFFLFFQRLLIEGIATTGMKR